MASPKKRKRKTARPKAARPTRKPKAKGKLRAKVTGKPAKVSKATPAAKKPKPVSRSKASRPKSKPKAKAKPKISKAAFGARQRRAAARAAARAERERAARAAAAKHEAQLEKRRIRDRARRAEQRRRRELGEVLFAEEWLERIANDIGTVFTVNYYPVEALGGVADLLEGTRDSIAAGGEAGIDTAEHNRWLRVGRYEPLDTISYAELGHALRVVEDDLILEAMIHPQRLSQIRIVFADPNERRHEGDSVISTIGPWGYVISDQVRELVGASWEEPGEDSLAARYAQSTAVRFYIFFSGEILGTRSPPGFGGSPQGKERSTQIPWSKRS